MNDARTSFFQDNSGREPRRGAAMLFLLPLAFAVATAAQGQSVKITQLAISGASATFGSGVNSKSQVAGYSVAGSVTKGFEWLGGTHYTTIVFSGSNNFTRALGINDSGEIVGDFLSSTDGFTHGFTDVNGTLTQYDVPGGLGKFSTSLYDIDNNGDLAGSANGQGFVSIGGVVTMFNGSGTDLTTTFAINDSHVAVGQYLDSSGNSHGFMWSNGTITEITFPGAAQTSCQGINDLGEITGFYIDSTGAQHGFTDINGVFTASDLPFIGGVNKTGVYVGNYAGPPAGTYGFLASAQSFKPSTVKVSGAKGTSIFDINDSNVMVGYYITSAGVSHGLMLSGTTATNIDDPNGVGNTFCYAINSSNQIVGYYAPTGNPSGAVGFYYAGGTFTDITGPAGATFVQALGINDSGEISGLFVDSKGKEHGFILSGIGGTYTQLDVPGAPQTYAWGINAGGEVTVGFMASGTLTLVTEAALYNGSTYTTINLPGAPTMFVHGIDKNGDLTYSWTDGNGNTHAGLLSSGSYYLLDDSSGTNTAAYGINDSAVIAGRYMTKGSSNFAGFKGQK
ncbi:MAG TPA: hypothetical protein VGW33_01625 [Terriglobia bacterium]|nr:hypothetical protein [Terriglobia bacterium]